MTATRTLVAVLLAAALSATVLPPARAAAPVVVELFTSQGCSSCPPADDLLRRIAADPSLRGRVIPLAYHVDYWDHLGWRDPFSAKAWTIRQMEYVRALGLGSAYTPQAVVAGGHELIGSNERALRAAIGAAASAPADAGLQVRLDGSNAVVSTDAHGAALDLILLMTEDDVTTRIARGENGGMTLTNGSIVRRLERLGAVPPGAATRRVPLVVDPAWNRARTNLIVLLQDPKTLRIHAAAMTKGP